MQILIIEDNIVYSKSIKKKLESKLLFVDCDIVSTFSELKNIKKEYDLYICDLILPDSKGEHIQYLTKYNKYVIVMTGYENINIDEDLKCSVLDYIIKDDISTIDYLVNFVKRLYKNKNINVLIVEDSDIIRKHQKNILKKIWLNIYEAKNGVEAFEIFKNQNIDLIITDLMMPECDGITLIKKVRKDKKINELPIIAISSSEEKELFLKSLKLGANDFLKKPFSKEELVLRVNNLLDLYDNYKNIQYQLLKDTLTGVYNRFYLENVLEKLFYNYEQKSIAMLDIDFFKKLNDTYGHQFGDEVLKYFTEVVKNTIRKSDIIVRYGGEEFLLFMPNTSKKEAFIVMLKIMKNLLPYKNIKITFSAGIAEEGESLAEMIKIADKRLYRAKEEGRNKIVID